MFFQRIAIIVPVVKLSYPEYMLSFPNDINVLWRQLPASRKWGEFEFAINDKQITTCDYWIVYNDMGLVASETVMCPPEHVIFISDEPETVYTYPKRFLAQFYQVVSCQQNMLHDNTVMSLTGQTWFVDKSFDELMQTDHIEKTKAISVLCSDKQFTAGHKQRYDFVKRLKQHFGDHLEWFGRGVQDFDDKWDVLAPYRFSIAIENSVYPHYMTEKLSDCYLAHTMPLYFGCPNVTDYFDEQSLVKIDLEDFDGTVKTIEHILAESDYYERHFSSIKHAKQCYLMQYQFFPLMVSLLAALPEGGTPKAVTLQPETAFSMKRRVKKMIKRIIGRH